jgi:phage shock protein A
MSLMKRIGNLWRGFLSLWISDVEKQRPEIAYENAINSMIEKYSKLKSATASIIRRREDLEERYRSTAAELQQAEADLNTAVDTSQDDLALVLIQKQNDLNRQLSELEGELQMAQNDADSARSSLLNVQAEIKKLKTERDSMLARMQSAQARIKVQEQLDGLSVDTEVRALDNVRTHIRNTIAEASLGKELTEESLEGRLSRLRQQTGDVQARKQLEELKARRATQQGQKTM